MGYQIYSLGRTLGWVAGIEPMLASIVAVVGSIKPIGAGTLGTVDTMDTSTQPGDAHRTFEDVVERK
jgi:hypothetical protein